MKAAMADDKAKHNILPISQLGIMQITRQRHDESNSSGIYDACPYCTGRGIVKSPRAVSIEIQRKISNAISRYKAMEPATAELKLKVFLHPGNLRRLRGPDSKLIERMQRNYNLSLTFEAAETYHVENFKVIDETTGEEVK
jgi:ribonuclease G